MANELKILDLGCGKNKQKDATVGIDNIQLPGVDIVWDLSKFPYPFGTSNIDKVYCSHILEHFEHGTRDKILKEVYRILRPGGKIEIRVPHAFSIVANIDPTHKTYYCLGTVDYFVKNNKYSYYKEINYDFKLEKTWVNLHLFKEHNSLFKKKLSSYSSVIVNRLFKINGINPDLLIKILPIYSVELVWVLKRGL